MNSNLRVHARLWLYTCTHLHVNSKWSVPGWSGSRDADPSSSTIPLPIPISLSRPPTIIATGLDEYVVIVTVLLGPELPFTPWIATVKVITVSAVFKIEEIMISLWVWQLHFKTAKLTRGGDCDKRLCRKVPNSESYSGIRNMKWITCKIWKA